MQAEGFLTQRQRHPTSLAAAVAINAIAVGAVLLAKSDYVPRIPTILIGENIPLTEPPPPEPTEAKPRAAKPSRVDSVAPPIPMPLPRGADLLPPVQDYVPAGTGDFPTGVDVAVTVVTPDPVLVEARPDPRYAGAFQPSYPPGKQRLGEEGRVVARVLVGIDGRVKEIVPVGSVDPDFWRATEQQAIRRWRFVPATRDGVPYESWRQMTVRFQIGV